MPAAARQARAAEGRACNVYVRAYIACMHANMEIRDGLCSHRNAARPPTGALHRDDSSRCVSRLAHAGVCLWGYHAEACAASPEEHWGRARGSETGRLDAGHVWQGADLPTTVRHQPACAASADRLNERRMARGCAAGTTGQRRSTQEEIRTGGASDASVACSLCDWRRCACVRAVTSGRRHHNRRGRGAGAHA